MSIALALNVAQPEFAQGPIGTAAAPALTQPLRLIVPNAPGGPTDTVARLVGQKLAEWLGVAVVIDNRPCASGTVGGGTVARSAPDGRTLLLTSSSARIEPAPAVPTVAEAVLPGFEAATWYGVVAPAGVSADVQQKLHSGIHGVLQLPEARDYMASLGFAPVGDGPKAFAEIIRTDLVNWERVVRSAKKR